MLSLADSSLIARPLAPNHRVVCAAPAYLREHGEPAHPADLIRHRCIVIGDSPGAEWRFIGDEPVNVRIDAGLVSNDGGVVLAWALAGAGIALKSIWDVGNDLAADRLRRVLPDYAVAAAPLHAIYPHSAHLAPRVRAFVDYLRERLQAAWRWESPPGA
ncbi:substrate binding domain-containing protein [Lysobacter sp. ISL-42]|nr:substrate binding domain-containing protein [Lysobacter sp. ISL-42]MBT2750676.1 substrate binding domain-containing protein [Lysobacter sp. ISL-50]MBT2779505.1 substrate binding domain-containing protein [Lysobacter sp. ISL-54]MBT2784649.1 substrate binding domain-containing protein [Lysobacter sp. ISL-52]